MEEYLQIESILEITCKILEEKKRDALKTALTNIVDCLNTNKNFTNESMTIFESKNPVEYEILTRQLGEIEEPHNWIASVYMKARELNLVDLKDLENGLAAATEGLGEKVDCEIKSRKKALEASTSPRIVFKDIVNLRLDNLELPSQDVTEWFYRFEIQTRGWTEENRGLEVAKFFNGIVLDEYLNMDLNRAHRYLDIKDHMLRAFGEKGRNNLSKFVNARQKPGEKFRDFGYRLKNIIEKAECRQKPVLREELVDKLKKSCVSEIRNVLLFTKLDTFEEIIEAGTEVETEYDRLKTKKEEILIEDLRREVENLKKEKRVELMRQGNEYEKVIKKIKMNRAAEIKRLRDTLNTIKQNE